MTKYDYIREIRDMIKIYLMADGHDSSWYENKSDKKLEWEEQRLRHRQV